jgi:Transport protein particle (TRAPP) complex subunit
MFLGVQCDVTNYVEKDNCFSLIMPDNPLIDFVELPKHLQGLYYSNIICGVIRGALEAVLRNFHCLIFRFISELIVIL